MIRRLARAERDFRRIVRSTYPLSADMPVLIEDPDGAPFGAYTDNRAIHVQIDPVAFEKQFAHLAGHHKGSGHLLYGLSKAIQEPSLAEHLPYDLFLVVLFHELYHPLICPNSREDEKSISQAMCRGLKAVEPQLPAKDLLYKVDHCKNLVWDVVVNVSLLARLRRHLLHERITTLFREDARAIEEQPVQELPRGALPILYLISAEQGTTDLLISLAGLFYASLSYDDPDTRARSMAVFIADLQKKGLANPHDWLVRWYHALDPSSDFQKRADLVRDPRHPAYEENQEMLLKTMDRVFDRYDTRYAAIERLAEVLAPLVSPLEKQGSPDRNTSSWGGEEALPEDREVDSLSATIDDLAGELDVETVLKEMAGNAQPGRGGLPQEKADALRIFAQDELLKRIAEPIEIRAPGGGLALVDLGQQQRWEIKRSQDLTGTELASLDLAKIVEAQAATGLPFLMELAENRYKLNEFALAESPVRGWAPQQYTIDVPENWVLFLDSSGSMCGAPFDLLLRTTYGIQKGIYEVCTVRKKDIRFGVVNFSSQTIYSGLDSFLTVYVSHTHKTKEVLFNQQSGGTSIDGSVFPRIWKDLAPGRTVYTLITDGYISNENEVFTEIEHLARSPNTAVLFIEITTQSELGEKLANIPGVLYRKVDKVEDIRTSLEQVLIRYVPRGPVIASSPILPRARSDRLGTSRRGR